jgi:hypothetical protein
LKISEVIANPATVSQLSASFGTTQHHLLARESFQMELSAYFGLIFFCQGVKKNDKQTTFNM